MPALSVPARTSSSPSPRTWLLRAAAAFAAMLALLLMPSAAFAAVCTSITSGDWGDSTTWSCAEVPDADDSVVIQEAVTVDGYRSAASVTVNSTLTIPASNRLTIVGGDSVAGTFVNPGTTTGDGTLRTTGNVTLNVPSYTGFDARLEVASGVTTTISNPTEFEDEVYVSGGTLRPAANTQLILADDTSVAEGATIDAGGTGTTLYFRGAANLINGTVAHPNVRFDATIPQAIDGGGTIGVGDDSVVSFDGGAVAKSFPNSLVLDVETIHNSVLLTLPDVHTFTDPSTGTDPLTFNNPGSVVGAGTFRTLGNVVLNVPSYTAFDVPLVVAGGVTTTIANPTDFDDTVTVSGGTLRLAANTQLILKDDTEIAEGATIDAGGTGTTLYFRGVATTIDGTVAHGNIYFDAWTGQALLGAGAIGLGDGSTLTFAGEGTKTFPGALTLDFETIHNASTLLLPDVHTFTDPSTGTDPLTFNNPGSVIGDGTFRTSGNVVLNVPSYTTFEVALVVAGGVTTTIANPTDFDDTVTVSAGTLRLAANTQLILDETVSVAAGATIDAAGTGTTLYFRSATTTVDGTASLTSVRFDALGTQTITGSGTIGAGDGTTLALDGGIKTLSGTLTLDVETIDNNATLSLADEQTFTDPSTGSDPLTFNNPGTVTGNGPFRVTGTVAMNVPSYTLFEAPLLVAGGTTTTISATEFDGPVTVTGGTLRIQTGTSLALQGSLTVGPSGTIEGEHAAAILYFRGAAASLTNDGQIGVGEVRFDYDRSQTMSGSGFTRSVNVLYGTLTLTSDHTFGVIDGYAGTIDITGRTVRVTGPGNALPHTGPTTTTNSTIVYAGTAAQTVGTGVSYANLAIDNAAGVTLNAAETVPGTLSLVTGAFATGPNLTLADDATVSRTGGTLTGTPTFAGSVNLSYSGTNRTFTAGPEVPPNASSLKDLTLADAGGSLNLIQDVQVNGVLTMTAGRIITGTDALVMGADATYLRTSGFVEGNLKRLFGSTASTRVFPLGTGTDFSPVTVAATSLDVTDGTAYLTARAVASAVSATPAKAIARHWILTDGGIGTANLTFKYVPTDVPGTADQTRFRVIRGETSFELPGGTTDNVDQAAGLASVTTSQFSKWSVAEAPSVAFSSSTYSEPENQGLGRAVISVTRSGGGDGTVTVDYATSDGTATAGTDYTAKSGILTFAPGSTPQTQTFNVAITNDTSDEPDETIGLALSGATGGATLGNPSASTLTLTDDDPPPDMSVVNVSRTEDAANLTFTVSITPVSGKTVTVDYATSNGTAAAGSDYTATSGTLTFAPGTTSRTIDVPILEDINDEFDETFQVTLSSPVNAVLTDSTATGTITDDDPPASISIADASFAEGAGNGSVVVSVSPASGKQITVSYATSNGTATAGSDYTAKSGTLTFAPGDTSETISVPILQDTRDEPAGETFTVTLSSATNGTLTDATATATITDDDPTPTLAVNNPPTVTEGTTTSASPATTVPVTFTLTLSAASNQTVSVKVATANGSASAGTDYTALPLTTVTFTPGQTSRTVTVNVNRDARDDAASETFLLNLSAPTNATIADAQGVATITDDDPTPTLVINNPPTITEGTTTSASPATTVPVTFTISLSTPSNQTVTVKYATANGTAAATSDYTALPLTTVTFSPGQTSKTVTVQVKRDARDDAPSETFFLNLSAPTNATLADAQGVATITDDDPTPSIAITNGSVTEPDLNAGNFASFTVTLSAASNRIVTVKYATANGTAIAGSDYTAVPLTTLTFSPGQTSKLVTVAIIGDNTKEANETFAVNLSAAANATIADTQGLGTIVNDD